MSKSEARVRAAIEALELDANILHMPASTRTAADAAEACACDVAQIAKSMIFEGAESGALKLLIVSGAHQVDVARAPELFGEGLVRADAKRVRKETGFAIGGVAPLGHLNPIETWMEDHLLTYPLVWAAAGTPSAVFSITPDALHAATGATLFSLDPAKG